MFVLNTLKNRGISKIDIICSDNLKGISQSIETVYPESKQQRCIVHMIRNSAKFVYYKDLKEFCNDLKQFTKQIIFLMPRKIWIYLKKNEVKNIQHLYQFEEEIEPK